MNDHDLAPDEVDRLRSVLRRAAARVEVPPEPAGIAGPPPQRTRRLLAPLLAAAAVSLIAGFGAWLLLGGDSGQDIDTGPADDSDVTQPPVTLSPVVQEQTGVRRLPEGLDGYKLIGAQDLGITGGWETTGPGAIATDSPTDPKRWVLVQSYEEFSTADDALTPFDAAPGLVGHTVASESPGGGIWFQVEPVTGQGIGTVISGTVTGITESELVAALNATYRAPSDLVAADGFSASADLLVEQLGLTGGETYRWEGNGPPSGAVQPASPSVDLTLSATKPRAPSPDVVISLSSPVRTPAWANAIRVVVQADLMSVQRGPGYSPYSYSWSRRTDLGPYVVELTPSVPGAGGLTTLVVFTDDGTMIRISESSMLPVESVEIPVGAALTQLEGVTAGGAGQSSTEATTTTPARTEADPTVEPADVSELLRIVNSLRAVTEQRFGEQLTASGIEFIGPGGLSGPATTVADEPDD